MGPAVERVEEIAIATKNSEKALKLFEDLFGLKFDMTWEIEDAKVKAATLGHTQIQMLEPIREGVIAKFIRKRGEGIHHICFKVTDLEGMINKFREKGIRLVPEEPVRFGETSYIFVHPKSACGVLIELLEI